MEEVGVEGRAENVRVAGFDVAGGLLWLLLRCFGGIG